MAAHHAVGSTHVVKAAVAVLTLVGVARVLPTGPPRCDGAVELAGRDRFGDGSAARSRYRRWRPG